jgi:hypothetical protein
MIVMKQSGCIGDCIYSLCAGRDLALRSGEKCRFLLACDVPAQYPPGFIHPSGNVLLSRRFAEMLLPLLRRQSWIAEADIWQGETVDVDLDQFRQLPGQVLSGTGIARWWGLVHQCQVKSWEPWLEADPVEEWQDYLVVSRTFRYCNPAIRYDFLQAYDKVVFLGLPEEWERIRNRLGPKAEFKTGKDLLECAGIILACRCFVGCASAMFALAEATKRGRCLEIYPKMPNTTVIGPGPGFESLTQEHFEWAVSQAAACNRK